MLDGSFLLPRGPDAILPHGSVHGGSIGGMNLADYILHDLSSVAPRTRALLERLPADKLYFSPGSGLQTVGWNANHLANIPSWPGMIVEQDELNLDPSQPFDAETSDHPAKIVATFDRNLEAGRKIIAGASDEKLAEPWTMKYAGQTLYSMTKGDVLRTWVVMHLVHHTAILSSHLRLAGVEMGSLLEEMPGPTL